MFCFPENIENEATKLFGQLKSDKFLGGLEPEEFAGKAAHFLSELNVLHAFREGNGRTQLSCCSALRSWSSPAKSLRCSYMVVFGTVMRGAHIAIYLKQIP